MTLTALENQIQKCDKILTGLEEAGLDKTSALREIHVLIGLITTFKAQVVRAVAFIKDNKPELALTELGDYVVRTT